MASEAWSKLDTLYQAHDTVTRMYLLDELDTLEVREGASLTKHTLIDELSSAGVVTTHENQYLLICLPCYEVE